MTNLPITELGISGTAIGALYLVTRNFLDHLKKKDEQFTTTINNHMHESIEVRERLIASNNRMNDALNRLADRIK